MYSKANIVREYLDKFGDIANRTLARKLNTDMPEVFPTIDHARDTVRYVVGSFGKKDRKKVSNTKYMKPENIEKLLNINDGEHFDFKPYIIPKRIIRLGIISDEQIPFHDKYAIVTAMEHFYKRGVQAILFNGDTWDAYNISSFVKDPRQRRFPEELDQVRKYLSSVRKLFPDIDLYYKEGNHEERWERYLKIYAPVLLETNEFELDVILRLRENSIHWINNKRLIKFGKLNILHGHEYRSGFGGGVNPARWLFLKGHENMCCGHFHQISQHEERKVTGEPIGCWSMGCMCDLNPDYMPYNKWSHGFGYVERLDDRGHFRFKNLRVENYKIV